MESNTEIRLKSEDKKVMAEYELSIRYFHLKATLAIIVTLTTCLLYLAPFIGQPGVVVPETLNMLTSSILAAFFFSKGTASKQDKEGSNGK